MVLDVLLLPLCYSNSNNALLLHNQFTGLIMPILPFVNGAFL